MVPAGYEQKTVGAAAVALASVPDRSNYALITVAGGAVRYRDDGTDPTAAVGHPLEAGDILHYTGNRADVLKFIRRDSTDATLDVTYYK